MATSCGIGGRCSSDLALLWPWCRLVAVAPIGPLAWERPCCLISKKVSKGIMELIILNCKSCLREDGQKSSSSERGHAEWRLGVRVKSSVRKPGLASSPLGEGFWASHLISLIPGELSSRMVSLQCKACW